MKQRIENLSFEGVMIPIAEIELVNCWASTSDNSAKTLHKVSSVRTIEGQELVTELKSYNHPFHEGMQSLSLYLSDPTT